MNKNLALTLGLSLLLASCADKSVFDTPKPATTLAPTPVGGIPINEGGSTTTPSGNTNQATANDTLPDVAIPAAPTAPATCTNTSEKVSYSEILTSPFMLDRGQRVKLFQPNAISGTSIYSLLAETKKDLNKYYFGYSDVDLNALHTENYNNFKAAFPESLKTYSLGKLNATQNEMVDNLMASYVDKIGDAHTFYLTAAQTNATSTGGTPTPSFGLSLAFVPNGDGFVVTDVRWGSPAQVAGIKRGDVILSINGTALKRNGASNKELNRVYGELYSQAQSSGKAVSLVVSFAGERRTLELTGTVLQGTALPWGKFIIDNNGKTHYYLRIPTFYSVESDKTNENPLPIASKVHELIEKANTQGATDIIVDLRDNQGGHVAEYIGAAGPLVPKLASETLLTRDGSSSVMKYNAGVVQFQKNCKTPETIATLANPVWTGKVTVLVNGDSASASEGFSTMLQQSGFKVIGEKTFGVNDTATNYFDLPGGRSISITTVRSFINGKATPKQVTPDIAATDDLTHLAATGIDDSLQAAYDALK